MKTGMETWEGTEVMGKSSNARYRIDQPSSLPNQLQVGIEDSDTIPDPTSLQPLDASVKTEQLRHTMHVLM
jgi:hypothetical protein